ncbi:hypothetical protein NE237_024779 [Protea cynaroides]|uniref:Uncharacterized protein n=1 Tax=Protea cynaroides TaxID=273540 RepID=A0A9Q0H3M6_9MAGN|nr:hypothetical protein NE237_024779 [Protea cynaroides]
MTVNPVGNVLKTSKGGVNYDSMLDEVSRQDSSSGMNVGFSNVKDYRNPNQLLTRATLGFSQATRPGMSTGYQTWSRERHGCLKVSAAMLIRKSEDMFYFGFEVQHIKARESGVLEGIGSWSTAIQETHEVDCEEGMVNTSGNLPLASVEGAIGQGREYGRRLGRIGC